MEQSQLNDTSGVIWAVGLSRSGKTTLLRALHRKVLQAHSNVISLDGDAIRECIGNTEDFSQANRIQQFQRMQRLAQEFHSQGLIVLVTTLYCNNELLRKNRRLYTNYFEIYLDAPLHTLLNEDNKSVYRDYLGGKVTNVVGMDIEWIPPDSPDIITSKYAADPDTIADEVIRRIPFL